MLLFQELAIPSFRKPVLAFRSPNGRQKRNTDPVSWSLISLFWTWTYVLLIRRSLVQVQQGEPWKNHLLLQVVFSAKFALRRAILLRSDIRLTPSDIALRAAIGEFNIAFCDSKKYRNSEGIISHFALAKYFTKSRTAAYPGGFLLSWRIQGTATVRRTPLVANRSPFQ